MKYKIPLLIIIILFFFPGYSLAISVMDGRNQVINDLESLIYRDSSGEGMAEMQEEWKLDVKAGLPDSLLFRWVQSIGIRTVRKGRHAEVSGLFSDALDYFSETDCQERDMYLLILRSRMGALYEEMGLWSKAMNMYFDALRLSESPQEYLEYGNILNNIGNVYFKQGYYDDAKLYYDSAITVNKRNKNSKELINNYNNLAGLYYMQGDYTQTIAALNQAIAQLDPDKDPETYYPMIQNLAVVYSKQGKLELAMGFVKEAISYYQKEQRSLDLIQSYLIISSLYASENSDSSKVFIDKALTLSGKVRNPAAEISALQAQYQWYRNHHLYREACASLEQMMYLQDSLEQLDNRLRIENIEAANAVERESREKDILLQRMRISQLEGQKQRVILLALVFCLMVGLCVVVYYFFLQKRMKKEAEKVSQQRQELFEKEKEMMDRKAHELSDTLELRNKELTSKVLYLVRTNEYIADINKELQQLLLELNPKDIAKKQHVKELMVKLRNQGDEGTYAEFKYYFEQVYQSFYQNLQKEFPDLTYKDMRLCSFLKLGLSTKEIAAITFKEVRSVESARNRLRKKMNLEADVNLIEFFSRF